MFKTQVGDIERIYHALNLGFTTRISTVRLDQPPSNGYEQPQSLESVSTYLKPNKNDGGGCYTIETIIIPTGYAVLQAMNGHALRVPVEGMRKRLGGSYIKVIQSKVQVIGRAAHTVTYGTPRERIFELKTTQPLLTPKELEVALDEHGKILEAVVNSLVSANVDYRFDRLL